MTLAQIRRFALSLPETTEEPHHRMLSFRVYAKIFAAVPPEGTHLHIFVDDDHRALALAAHPDSCENLWWGAGVAGLRVTFTKARAALHQQDSRSALRAFALREDPLELIPPHRARRRTRRARRHVAHRR